jgi:hypothetical protein
MMRYRLLNLALLATCLFSGQVSAGTTRAIAATSTTLIINKGSGHKTKLRDGFTAIDEPTQIECESSNGCLISIDAAVGVSISDSAWKICFKIDSNDIEPSCPVQGEDIPLLENTGSALGSQEVTTGTHTVQTFAHVHVVDSGEPPTLKSWEVHYTVYGE